MNTCENKQWFITSIFILLCSLSLGVLNAQVPETNPESKPLAKIDQDKKVNLSFKFKTGEILTIDKYQDIRISNGTRWISREEKNRIVLKVHDTNSNGSRMKGSFITYSRSPRKTGAFQLNKKYKTDFLLQSNGKYIVPNRFMMPNLRSMPSFPERAISPGDEWQIPAEEIMNVGRLKILMPVKPNYLYVGKDELDLPGIQKRMLDRIEYKYTINHPVRNISRTGRKVQAPIRRISGFVMCVLWFDGEAGIPVYDSCRLAYNFQLYNGKHQEYLFRIESWYNKAKQINDSQKNEIVANIQKDLGDNKKVKVRQHKDGIILEISDILFKHNSSTLDPDAQKQLAQIADILKRHPNREIRVLGHTDSNGRPAFNRRLSTNRARNVLKALEKKHSIKGRRLSFKGYGESAPIVSNATREGRARNRRVEILIVTE